MNDKLLFLETSKNDFFVNDYLNEMLNRREIYLWAEHLLPDWLVEDRIRVYILKLLFPFFYFIYCTYCLFKTLVITIKSSHICLHNGEYYSASGPFSSAINKRVNKYINNATWVLNSGINPADYTIKDSKYVTIFQILKIKDIFSCYYDSLVILFLVYRKFSGRYILFALKSYSWLLYYNALKYIPPQSTIYFHDQKDRWAFCVDKLNISRKVLIQHGSEISIKFNQGDLKIGKGKYCRPVPYRLKTISEIYAFSEDEYKAIVSSIVEGNPQKYITGYELDIRTIPHSRPSILIVGHVCLYGDIEEKLISDLQSLNVDIYVKNHPTQDRSFYEKILLKYSFNLVDNDFFPDVDIVVSYNSTLAFEYESIGKIVIYHTKKTYCEIIEQIKQNVESINNDR